jgi:hypothetical protein
MLLPLDEEEVVAGDQPDQIAALPAIRLGHVNNDELAEQLLSYRPVCYTTARLSVRLIRDRMFTLASLQSASPL